jgi:4-hydroxyacetophenone monooxygenase
MAPTCRCWRRSWRTRARTAARRSGAPTSWPRATDVRVVIIGAGMSGILAGHRLQQAGVPFTILDKNDRRRWHVVRGAYPGCRVDNPNHNYSYSFAQRHDWPFHYSSQDVLHDYFADCADAFDVRRHAQLGLHRHALRVERRAADVDRALRRRRPARSAPSRPACHQRGRPAQPAEVPHRDRRLRHVRRRDHALGTVAPRSVARGQARGVHRHRRQRAAVPAARGCAGVRAGHHAAHAPWLAPTPDYHEECPSASPGCTVTCPATASSTASPSSGGWATAHWRVCASTRRGRATVVRSAWSASSAARCWSSTSTAEFGDRPDLLSKVVPNYPVGAKRMVRDNGVWARTLKLPHVHLVTDAIARITATGIEMADGTCTRPTCWSTAPVTRHRSSSRRCR